jgi:hypothetical protein
MQVSFLIDFFSFFGFFMHTALHFRNYSRLSRDEKEGGGG